MKTIKGDIVKLALEGKFGVIVHGCNCFHTMNSGVAKAIRAAFPEVYDTDIKNTKKGDRGKLGTISYVCINRPNVSFFVVNAYTQYDYGYDGKRRVDYDAVRSAFRQVANIFPAAKIAYPKIGAGLAGGDWEIISYIIDEELSYSDHTLVEFEAVSDTPSPSTGPNIFQS